MNLPPQSLADLMNVTQLNDLDLINWCFDQNVFKTFRCIFCQSDLKIIHSEGKGDNYIWRCGNDNCLLKYSIRFRSLFFNSHLSLRVLLLLVACWIENLSIKHTRKITQLNRNTVTEWFCRLRKIAIGLYLHDIQSNPIGGPFRNVQIDETLIGKAKYNRGKALLLPQYWVLGIIDNETNRIFISHVSKRDSNTLLPLIAQNVTVGSIVVTDSWKAYRKLEELGYYHYMVNHKRNFVCPITKVHTQKIESLWFELKTFLRRYHSRNRNSYQDYLFEFAFRKNYKNDFQSIWLSFFH